MGCIPSKALLNQTHHLHVAQHQFKGMGINVGDISVDWDQMLKSKQSAVTGLTGGIEYLFKKNKVDYVKGWGKFASANDIDVDLNAGGTQKVSAKNIIIATALHLIHFQHPPDFPSMNSTSFQAQVVSRLNLFPRK